MSGERNQRRRHSQKDVASDGQLPERRQAEGFCRNPPTGQMHFSETEQGAFAQFMVAEGESRAIAEFSAQFAKAFLRALAGGRITHTHKAAVAGIIPVADE